MEDRDNLITILCNKAKKAVPYCWHLNGQEEDPESIHHFIDVSLSDYILLMTKGGFMNKKNLKVSYKKAEELACLINIMAGMKIAEATKYTQKKFVYLILGDQSSDSRDRFTSPDEQYDAQTKKLKHEPKKCHLMPTATTALPGGIMVPCFSPS